MSSFCTSCGEQLNGNFCTRCGVPRSQNTTQGPVAGNQIPAPNPNAELFAERVRREARAREVELEKIEAERRTQAAEALAKAKQERLEARRERIRAVRASVMRRKALWFPIFSLVLVAISYGTAQLTITAANGPSLKLEELVSAIKDADFEALKDETLFPGASGPVPMWIQNSFNKESVKDLEVFSISQSGDTATAKVGLSNSGDYFVASLTSTTSWDGLFQVPKWTVSALGNSAEFATDSSILKFQTVKFINNNGGSGKSFAAKSVNSWKPMSLLPGFYSLEVEKYGFSGGGKIEAGYWPQDNQLTYIPITSELEITPAVRARAESRANYIAQHCGNIKCSRLPRYDEYDFTLWSQWNYTKYTYSSFDYRWSYDYCTKESETALSATTARFTYTCGLTANAHLYVKWIYYYGYFSDYYYYDNLYDSTSDEITVTFDLKTSRSGK